MPWVTCLWECPRVQVVEKGDVARSFVLRKDKTRGKARCLALVSASALNVDSLCVSFFSSRTEHNCTARYSSWKSTHKSYTHVTLSVTQSSLTLTVVTPWTVLFSCTDQQSKTWTKKSINYWFWLILHEKYMWTDVTNESSIEVKDLSFHLNTSGQGKLRFFVCANSSFVLFALLLTQKRGKRQKESHLGVLSLTDLHLQSHSIHPPTLSLWLVWSLVTPGSLFGDKSSGSLAHGDRVLIFKTSHKTTHTRQLIQDNSSSFPCHALLMASFLLFSLFLPDLLVSYRATNLTKMDLLHILLLLLLLHHIFLLLLLHRQSLVPVPRNQAKGFIRPDESCASGEYPFCHFWLKHGQRLRSCIVFPFLFLLPSCFPPNVPSCSVLVSMSLCFYVILSFSFSLFLSVPRLFSIQLCACHHTVCDQTRRHKWHL